MGSIQHHHRTQSKRWRIILVGRTGLDQMLRRDGSIELIRARDTIDALGELSDPIDASSPTNAAVLVSGAIEPDENELQSFITGLRLIDHRVRVLRVADSTRPGYDGSIGPNADLGEILSAINAATPAERSTSTPVELRFVDPNAEPVTEPDTGPDAEPDTEPDTATDEDPSDQQPPQADPPPEVVIVARNEGFKHRAQGSFEDESEIHKQVLIGIEPEPSTASAQQPTESIAIAGPHDDQPLVEAMLGGRSIIEPAIERINTRLGRTDIAYIQDLGDGQAGIEITIGEHAVGRLIAKDHRWAMGEGHDQLAHQASWLSRWVRLDIQQRELRKSAFTDPLTGAWNRRYFSRFLDAAIVGAKTARRPLTVMLFDIDNFKHYNDTYGHAAGDEILIETVKLLTSVIRPSDRVCRVGGDEFAVIFYEPDGPRDPSSKPLESVYQIARRFQMQICQHNFPKLADEALGTLTVSGGLASYPWDGHNAESLLDQADQLAMDSKRHGKNAITLGPGAECVCKIEY